MTSGIKCTAENFDLDQFFAPYVAGMPKAPVTGIDVAGADINTRYAPRSMGSTAQATGIFVNGADLNTLFAALGTVNAIQPLFTFTVSGKTATFTNSSTDSGGTIQSYSWNFGDSNTSTSVNPSHTYASAGTYTVTLTVHATNGSNSASQSVTVSSSGGVPTAAFTFVVSGLTATFTDHSTDSGGTINSWSWQFGDNSVSSVQNASHTFAAPGSYNVTLEVQDSVSNAIGSVSHIVAVGGGGGVPNASFTASVSGLKATLTDTSTDTGGTIGAWHWDFGDGTTSTLQNVVHSYASPNTYTITLTVTDSVSGKQSSSSQTITIATVGGTPNATFTYATSGLTVTLTDTSTDSGGSIGSWAWNFGDGNTSTAQNPSHAYSSGGSYSVQETVTDSVSSKTSTITHSVTVAPTGGTPAASFTSATNGLTATFTDTSTDSGGTIGSWAWNFGDGATSTSQSPSHVYATAGTYSVQESVKDSVSGNTSSVTHSVTVAAIGGTPSAGFSYSPSGLLVAFTDTSTDSGGTINSWSWNFGDGNTSTAQNPSHTYSSAGTYTAQLTVTDSGSGKTSSVSHSLAVAPASGGGGGCAVITAFVADRVITDYAVHDTLPVMDDAGNFHMGSVTRLRGIELQPCIRIQTSKGCALAISTTTPVILRGGVTKWTPELVIGDQVGVRIHGADSWDTITNLESIGVHEVLLLTCDDLSFPAGETTTHQIYTHNTTKKD